MIYTRLADIVLVPGAKIAVSGHWTGRQNYDQSSVRKNWSHFVMSLIL